jgi:hypothetical protein
MPNIDPLESVIEKAVCEYAKRLGCLVYKFTSPARRSVPDRLFVMPYGKGVFFIEFKRKGGKPTAAQEVEINKILAQGTRAFVACSIAEGKKIVDDVLRDAPSYPSQKLTLADF